MVLTRCSNAEKTFPLVYVGDTRQVFMTIKIQPLGFVFRMSRGQKLLELALLANNDQPVTFIVNVDGSLSQLEGNHSEPPIEVNSTRAPLRQAHEVLD